MLMYRSRHSVVFVPQSVGSNHIYLNFGDICTVLLEHPEKQTTPCVTFRVYKREH